VLEGADRERSVSRCINKDSNAGRARLLDFHAIKSRTFTDLTITIRKAVGNSHVE
jgi:hypothetical protein